MPLRNTRALHLTSRKPISGGDVGLLRSSLTVTDNHEDLGFQDFSATWACDSVRDTNTLVSVAWAEGVLVRDMAGSDLFSCLEQSYGGLERLEPCFEYDAERDTWRFDGRRVREVAILRQLIVAPPLRDLGIGSATAFDLRRALAPFADLVIAHPEGCNSPSPDWDVPPTVRQLAETEIRPIQTVIHSLGHAGFSGANPSTPSAPRILAARTRRGPAAAFAIVDHHYLRGLLNWELSSESADSETGSDFVAGDHLAVSRVQRTLRVQ